MRQTSKLMSTLFRINLDQHLALFNRLDVLDAAVMTASQIVADSLRQGGKLLICGNGGSAADSQHIASEFTGRLVSDRRPLAALALGCSVPELTSIGNDYRFAEVFARQVAGLGRAGDCLMAISTSGNSENVVRAVEAARDLGIRTIGLLGHDGGRLIRLCEHAIVVPDRVTRPDPGGAHPDRSHHLWRRGTATGSRSTARGARMTPSREQLAGCRVLVVGDAMLDRYWFGSVDRISPEAPVPVVKVQREEDRLGGAANVALNVRHLGAAATLLAVVGDDGPAATLQTLLGREGIGGRIERDPGLKTIVKLRVIGQSQQLLRMDFESQADQAASERLMPDFEKALTGSDLVLFSDYGKGGLIHIDRMIALARQAGRPVLVDPKGSDYARYAGASVITPNRAELRQVIGAWHDEADLDLRVARLRQELGVGALLLTRSEEGMTLFDGVTDRLDVPALAREVFDVTGAGDSVIATLATMLACGMPLREAVQVANVAGRIVVGRFGTASVGYEELFP